MKQKFFLFFLIILLVIFGFAIWKIFFSTPFFSPEQDFSIRRILPENYEKGVPFEVELEIISEDNFIFSDYSFFLADVAENSKTFSYLDDLNSTTNNDLIFWKELYSKKNFVLYSVVSNADEINFNGRWEFNLNLSETGEGTYSGFVVGDSKIFAIAEEISQEISGGGGGGGGGGSSKDVGTQKNISDYYVLDEKNIYEVGSNFAGENPTQKEIRQKNLLWVYILISLIIFVGTIIFYFIFKKRFFEKV